MAYYSSPEMDKAAKSLIFTLSISSPNTHFADTWYCIAVGIIILQFEYETDIVRHVHSLPLTKVNM